MSIPGDWEDRAYWKVRDELTLAHAELVTARSALDAQEARAETLLAERDSAIAHRDDYETAFIEQGINLREARARIETLLALLGEACEIAEKASEPEGLTLLDAGRLGELAHFAHQPQRGGGGESRRAPSRP